MRNTKRELRIGVNVGLLSNIFGFGGLARDVGSAIRENTEVFHVNETEEMHSNAERFQSALSQYEAEFEGDEKGWFGNTVDGMNRLPRPIMALGTILLFVFALYDPDRFTTRMQGLQQVPDPLWWLMGAIVSFYFGARELHYFRANRGVNVSPKPAPPKKNQDLAAPKLAANNQNSLDVDKPVQPRPPSVSDNPAIQDWIESRR